MRQCVSQPAYPSIISVFLALFYLILSTPLHAASLTVQDQTRANLHAQSTPWPAVRTTITSTPHPLRVQTLSVELDERKSSPNSKRARIYQFDYQSRRARLLIVDLLSDEVVQQTALSSIHLPLSAEEIRYARDRLTATSHITDQLKAEQYNRGIKLFQSLDELDVKASIFEPLNKTHRCALERCALLSLFDHTRTVFATEPIVYLENGQVGTLVHSRR